MRKLILFINRLFAKLNIFSKKVYYVGGNDSLPPPLKKDEEEELVQELINGKEGVRDILIERNLRLVVYIARKCGRFNISGNHWINKSCKYF